MEKNRAAVGPEPEPLVSKTITFPHTSERVCTHDIITLVFFTITINYQVVIGRIHPLITPNRPWCPSSPFRASLQHLVDFHNNKKKKMMTDIFSNYDPAAMFSTSSLWGPKTRPLRIMCRIIYTSIPVDLLVLAAHVSCRPGVSSCGGQNLSALVLNSDQSNVHGTCGENRRLRVFCEQGELYHM